MLFIFNYKLLFNFYNLTSFMNSPFHNRSQSPSNNSAKSGKIEKIAFDNNRKLTKKQIFETLECLTDSVDTSNIVYTVDQIVENIENEIFIKAKSDSKSKLYRDKAKNIIVNLRGGTKSNIRIALKSGKLKVFEFLNLIDSNKIDEFMTNNNNDYNIKKNNFKPPKIKLNCVKTEG